MRELLVIADHPDPLADGLVDGITSRGWAVERLDYARAARRISISREGALCRVSPALPMLLRLPRSCGLWEGSEAQFHFAERRALVWAAAALTSAPVVNRPDAFGLASRALVAGSVLRRRAGFEGDAVEIVASACPKPLHSSRGWWVESLRDHVVRPWSPTVGKGPFRAGYVHEDLDQHLIIVAGSRAIGALDASLAELAKLACSRVGVQLAATSWRTGGGRPELIRIDPHLRPEHIAGYEAEVVDALLEVLGA